MDIDKVVVKEVSGCSDCHFYDCGMCKLSYMDGFSDVIDEDEEENPITPKWCPLKKNPVLIQII